VVGAGVEAVGVGVAMVVGVEGTGEGVGVTEAGVGAALETATMQQGPPGTMEEEVVVDVVEVVVALVVTGTAPAVAT